MNSESMGIIPTSPASFENKVLPFQHQYSSAYSVLTTKLVEKFLGDSTQGLVDQIKNSKFDLLSSWFECTILMRDSDTQGILSRRMFQEFSQYSVEDSNQSTQYQFVKAILKIASLLANHGYFEEAKKHISHAQIHKSFLDESDISRELLYLVKKQISFKDFDGALETCLAISRMNIKNQAYCSVIDSILLDSKRTVQGRSAMALSVAEKIAPEEELKSRALSSVLTFQILNQLLACAKKTMEMPFSNYKYVDKSHKLKALKVAIAEATLSGMKNSYIDKIKSLDERLKEYSPKKDFAEKFFQSALKNKDFNEARSLIDYVTCLHAKNRMVVGLSGEYARNGSFSEARACEGLLNAVKLWEGKQFVEYSNEMFQQIALYQEKMGFSDEAIFSREKIVKIRSPDCIQDLVLRDFVDEDIRAGKLDSAKKWAARIDCSYSRNDALFSLLRLHANNENYEEVFNVYSLLEESTLFFSKIDALTEIAATQIRQNNASFFTTIEKLEDAGLDKALISLKILNQLLNPVCLQIQ